MTETISDLGDQRRIEDSSYSLGHRTLKGTGTYGSSNKIANHVIDIAQKRDTTVPG